MVLAIGAAPAQASQWLSDTNVVKATLEVNNKGEALVTYTRSNGTVRHVLVWGAINALPPTSDLPQARFTFDYAGGWGKYRKPSYWKTFKNRCQPYDGPQLVDFVAACKAPDGSYWALQSWQRRLPLFGFTPWTAYQAGYELNISHWTGPLAQLAVGVHWTYGHSAIGIFGQLTYQGQPVHGFSATPKGVPKDRYSRTVYLDTHDSAYGAGWERETGILTHSPGGTFCHSFVPQTPPSYYPSQAVRPAAPGDEYRITVMGPGVTPVIEWDGRGVGPWTGSGEQVGAQQAANELWDGIMLGDTQCGPETGRG
ncbi:MAG TPA: hypothetical protein VGM80_15305 [Gaiellaceae bacterium]